MRADFSGAKLLVVMVVALAAMTGHARGQTSVVTARAAIDSEPVARGLTARIGIELKIDPRYHIQNAKPADPYLIPTSVKVKTAAGITAARARFPVDEKIAAPAGISKSGFLLVYHGTVYVIVPITIAVDAPLGPQKVAVSLTAQACDEDTCLPPKTFKIEVPVTVADAGTAAKAVEAGLFAAADKQAYAEEPVTATLPAGTLPTATVPAVVSTTQKAIEAEHGTAAKLMSDEEQVRVIGERPYKAFNAAEHEYPLYWIVALALLGGAILNVMPCVLPVIPLKVLSLVQQAHGDRRLAVLHGLAFSAGVVMLFVALAIVLRTFGLFYGQQFQSVGFLIALVMFVLALALSMLGVWTINPPKALYAVDTKISEGANRGLEYAGRGVESGRQHGEYLASFGNGLMATLLATPCSAPFLGGVLAWALVQPTWVAAVVLALVGVGMSFPYLVLAMFPGLLSKVPRAGRWSELLKQFLGIVMIGVAIWFIPNVPYWIWVLLGGVVVALVCWAWGQIPTYQMAAGKVWAIRVVAVILGAGLGVVLYFMGMRSAAAGTPMMAEDGKWRAFNVSLLDEALKEHRPVVVDWTASWCINCRFLEAAVLNAEGVQGAFKASNALLLRADLTRDNPPAELLNRKLGGEAIPVLALFSPDRPLEPVVLRDSYTEARVRKELAGAR